MIDFYFMGEVRERDHERETVIHRNTNTRAAATETCKVPFIKK